MDITERQIMGILDTSNLNQTGSDTTELKRVQRLEARRARKRAFSDAVAALCPSVFVALGGSSPQCVPEWGASMCLF